MSDPSTGNQGISTETGAMSQSAGNIDNIRAGMAKEVSNLVQEAQAMTSWKGTASGAFQKAMTHIEEVGGQMLKTLDSMGSNVSDNAKKYTNHDDSFAGLINVPL
jgi:WXG100 family type VII secretion target